MKRKLTAALCALALFAGLSAAIFTLSSPSARAAGKTVYFTSVNDTVLDLNDETMPFMVGGSLYVPYTMFDPDTTGVPLGVFTSYSRSQGAVLIYGWGGTLLFDLIEGHSTFRNEVYPDVAVIRNSMVFVPLDLVCELFGLDWSWLVVENGYVIRVKNTAAALDDREFTSAASYTLRTRYENYIQSQVSWPSAGPDDSPSATPSVTPSVPPATEGEIFLAFLLNGEDGFDDLLTELDYYSAHSLFLCRPEQLARQDDRIRTLLAAGHRVGLLLDADTAEGQLEQLALGRELMAYIAHAPVSICMSTGLSEEDSARLPDSIFLWHSTADSTSAPSSFAQSSVILSAAEGTNRCFFLLDDSGRSADALVRVLESLTANGYEFSPATETVLARP